ncbi:transcriptional regulator [Oscillatoria sp. FACHB-1407]|uniref:helix-turn-helix transcriptional regulator n=1 Tax=Oscillatoria sp. FACHB-1407 TaxID=2692847 RepID=UPI001685DDD6|nr:metalloregulator ArsR/SmtB family transcription factor [Oscillatoria sp. FACHB-1407]MBD2464334.1 transcriptional regulator [Oscillatoria sp. FACHB-1407]
METVRSNVEETGKPKVREQILHVLKMRGAQTATALAEQLQVSPMAIRQHLQSLKAEAWVTYQEEKRSMGRPVKLWQLTEHSVSRFPDSHADLILEVLRGVETIFGTEGMEKLVTERSRRQIQTYRTKLVEMGVDETWQQRIKAIAHLRNQEGYMAEVVEDADGWLLVENHCPICAAAQTCAGLCHAELDVFQAVLGSTVTVERVEHILKGDRRCAYRVRERE